MACQASWGETIDTCKAKGDVKEGMTGVDLEEETIETRKARILAAIIDPVRVVNIDHITSRFFVRNVCNILLGRMRNRRKSA